MITLLTPSSFKTESENAWNDVNYIINNDNNSAIQLGGISSHILANKFGSWRYPDSRVPDDAEIVGMELYVSHKTNDKVGGTQQLTEITLPINRSKWYDTGIDLNGENVTFKVNWSSQPYHQTNKRVYPEGYYSDTPNVDGHNYDPDACDDTVSGFSSLYAASNCRPWSLLAYVVDPTSDLYYGLTGTGSDATPVSTSETTAGTCNLTNTGWVANGGTAVQCLQTSGDSKYCSCAIPINIPNTGLLTATNFGFSIPSNAANIKVYLTINAKRVNGTSVYITGKITKDGSSASTTFSSQLLTTSYATYTFHVDSGYSYSDINASTFGFMLTPSGGGASPSVYVESATLHIEYTQGSGHPASDYFDRTISDAVQLNRFCTFSSGRLPNSGVGRLVLIFNDAVGSGYSSAGDYANNVGSFDVDIHVGKGEVSRIDAGLSIDSTYSMLSYKSFCSLLEKQVTILGTPTDKWGKDNWTPSELNDLAGIVFRRSIIDNENTVNTREIDSCWLVVYWNEPGGTFDMAERDAIKQKILFGKETVHGTGVTCTNRAMGFKVNPTMNGDFKGWRPQGNKNEQLQMLMREWCSSSLEGVPTYDEMGYILSSVIGAPVSSGGTINTRNVHTFRFDPRFDQDIVSYTIEYGTSDTRAHKTTYAFFDSMGLNFTRADAELSGSMIGRKITDGVSMSAGANEVQTITITGTPTGGGFKLRFKGAETAEIAYNAANSAIQTALNALSTIGANGVTVTGTTPNFTVTFSGTAMAGINHPLLELSNNALTGGTTPSVTLAVTTQGGFVEDALVPVMPGHINVYLADTYATLAAGKLTRARLANLAISNRADPQWVFDTTQDSFKFHSESAVDIKFNLELQADSNGMALLTTARSGAGKFIRIEAIGPVIGATSDTYKMVIEAFVKISAFGELKDTDGVYQTNYEMTVAEDPTWGNGFQIILENGKTAY